MKNILKSLFLIISVMAVSFSIKASDIDKLKILVDDYPPYSYKENDKLTGFAVDMLDAVLKKAASTLNAYDSELVPWANGYKQVLEGPNTVLYTMVKTPDREQLFKWVGPVSETSQVIFAKKGSGIKITSFDDIKKYKFGVVRGELGEDLLLKNGIDIESIDVSANAAANVKKFKAGRFDLLAGEGLVTPFEYKKSGSSPDEIEAVFSLSEAHFYYAFSRDVPDDVINALQTALDEIKKDGTVDKIKTKY